MSIDGEKHRAPLIDFPRYEGYYTSGAASDDNATAIVAQSIQSKTSVIPTMWIS